MSIIFLLANRENMFKGINLPSRLTLTSRCPESLKFSGTFFYFFQMNLNLLRSLPIMYLTAALADPDSCHVRTSSPA